jgi:RNA polymerase sigma-32 factor
MNTPTISYWRDVSRVPVLSTEEQLDLARRYAATGDRRLAHRLVTTNLRLVAKIARELATNRDNVDDLIQEGNAGLMVAVERFDPDRGAALSTYAGWWIRAFIKRCQMEHRGVVRTGTTRAQRKDFVEGRGGGRDLSLDQLVRPGEEGSGTLTRLALLQGRDEDRPDRLVEARDLHLKFGQLFARFQSSLDGRGQTIVRERWTRDDPPALKTVAKRFSLSGERARQIEHVLFERFREIVSRELAA